MPSGHTCLIRFSLDVSYLETCFVPQMLRAAGAGRGGRVFAGAQWLIVPTSCCFSNVFLMLLLLMFYFFSFKYVEKNMYFHSCHLHHSENLKTTHTNVVGIELPNFLLIVTSCCPARLLTL